MTKLKAIKTIINKANLSTEDEVLQHIRCILDGGDSQVEIEGLRQGDEEIQDEHEPPLRLWE